MIILLLLAQKECELLHTLEIFLNLPRHVLRRSPCAVAKAGRACTIRSAYRGLLVAQQIAGAADVELVARRLKAGAQRVQGLNHFAPGPPQRSLTHGGPDKTDSGTRLGGQIRLEFNASNATSADLSTAK
jgi:hypothetical protein